MASSKNAKSKKIKVADIVGKPRSAPVRKVKKEEEQPEPGPVIIAEPRTLDVATSETLRKETLTLEHRKDKEKIEDKVEQFEKEEVEKFSLEDDLAKKKKRFVFKTYFLFFVLLAVLGGGVYAAMEFLPRASIKIITKKFEWNYKDAAAATKRLTNVDVQNKQVPAEVFSKRKNFTFSFPATGKKFVQTRASGKVIVYNAYSSDKQPLVANTRFEAPDGKIFRLEKNITVPGATVVEGKIVPSTIEATVTADKVGAEYNIGPVEKFRIPGFKGTPKYNAFYAESKEAMKGGFVGEVPYPTDDDIKKSKEQAERSLKDNIESFLFLDISPAFKVLDGSKQFEVLKEQVNTAVDEKGDFTIFVDAQSSVVTFREENLLSLMKELANIDLRQQGQNGVGFKIKDYNVEYGAARLDLKQGQISFALDFKANLWQPINTDDFKQKALNKKEPDLRALIYSLPGNVEKATISFWPFWVQTVPDNLKRVKVEVE
jgi:hypothetical protein